MSADRDEILLCTNNARAAGARHSEARDIVGISAKTYQRWVKPDNVKDRRLDDTHEPRGAPTAA